MSLHWTSVVSLGSLLWLYGLSLEACLDWVGCLICAILLGLGSCFSLLAGLYLGLAVVSHGQGLVTWTGKTSLSQTLPVDRALWWGQERPL